VKNVFMLAFLFNQMMIFYLADHSPSRCFGEKPQYHGNILQCHDIVEQIEEENLTPW
jgi:hypothetical protein